MAEITAVETFLLSKVDGLAADTFKRLATRWP